MNSWNKQSIFLYCSFLRVLYVCYITFVMCMVWRMKVKCCTFRRHPVTPLPCFFINMHLLDWYFAAVGRQIVVLTVNVALYRLWRSVRETLLAKWNSDSTVSLTDLTLQHLTYNWFTVMASINISSHFVCCFQWICVWILKNDHIVLSVVCRSGY